MRVKELIQELQKLPDQDATVVYEYPFQGCDEVVEIASVTPGFIRHMKHGNFFVNSDSTENLRECEFISKAVRME